MYKLGTILKCIKRDYMQDCITPGYLYVALIYWGKNVTEIVDDDGARRRYHSSCFEIVLEP